MKTLYLLRHAKAETGSPAEDDHTRRLNGRGIEACAVMGAYLAGQGIRPDLVLCSTAERAADTWLRVKEAYAHPPAESYDDRLYLASANEMLSCIAAVPETVGALMIVGHNPGLHQLAVNLARAGEEKPLDLLSLAYPTCALAAIGLGDVLWKNIAKAKGELRLFVTPRVIAAE